MFGARLPAHSYLKVDESGAVVGHEGTTPRVSFGNVNEQSFKEIWRSPGYMQFRHEVESGAFPEPCKACLMKHYVICPQPPMSLRESLGTLINPEADT